MNLREDVLRLLRSGRIEDFNELSARRQLIVDLSNADLTDAKMGGADFRNVNLDGAKLVRAKLSASDFRGASLRFANFEGADLEGADFTKANLYCAYFAGAKLEGATILGADICSAVLPRDVHPEEIRLSLEVGTRLRHDPTIELLRKVLEKLGS